MEELAGEEVLEAEARIWNHIFSFINSMALKCVVQLGIPDAIARHDCSPMPLSHLISALQLHPQNSQYIHRLMCILAHSGFFITHKNGSEEEAYSLTNSSRLLLKHNPSSLSPFLLSMLDPLLLQPWQLLSAWFHSLNRTPFEMAHGRQFWEHMGNKQQDGDVFNAAMASDARLVSNILLGQYKNMFDGVKSLVDVGGGTGTMAKAIADAFPQTQCVVLDLFHVVADLEGSHNLTYLPGDMFQSIPPADVLLLKWILHDWSDGECVEILKKCKEAITSNGKTGKVILIDMVLGNKKGDDTFIETQLFWDMLMMANVSGKERDEKEWAQLFDKARFAGYKIFPVLGLRSLIEIYPR
ncbi:trans-resveratrol di-O-methyltransferase-like [Momordica charantia]|uniref:Trans-resveratrol di-O-methyltransferase-like n=1 Tax=Momordica charantia TaxID=3673 RepID=A0A6J1DTU5_MOMCH|nr:trans-resveratrol di-O-methyltransferase-like [Momordica charantia]